MADINSKEAVLVSGAAGMTPRCGQSDARGRIGARSAAELMTFVELLFFAYRDFTGDADDLLRDLNYGRAHHRVIHFVARHPGLRVADLLVILRITKQSLARVLKQLIDDGFVTQRSGQADRRERHLYLTQMGLNLADKLANLQCARIGHALEAMDPDARDAIEDFLVALISETDRTDVTELVEKANRYDSETRNRPTDDHAEQRLAGSK